MGRTAQDALGIYLSVPFCRSKCTYCNFASGVYPAADHARYAERLVEDLSQARTQTEEIGAALPRRVDSIYLGGGTPTLLAPELLLRIFDSIHAHFDVGSDAEITVECAPGQLPAETLEAMASIGVNRVSLGVQSFADDEAHASGRLHNRSMVESDLRSLRAAGITNLNVDLIAGLAGQTLASWEDSLNALIDSDVPHASIYMLEVDEDSRLGRELLQHGSRYGAGLVPNDDAIARMYDRAIERLGGADLSQYEISNFARPGFESRHNLRYWQRRPYLGVGLDASSMLRAAPSYQSVLSIAGSVPANPDFVLRTTTTDDLAAYLAGSAAAEISWLPIERQFEEAWFLGLRINTGVDLKLLCSEFGTELLASVRPTIDRLADDGLLISDGTCVRLTSRGRLLSNDVFQEFLEPKAAAATC